MLSHIHTKSGVTVVVDGLPYTLSTDHKYYDALVALLDSGATSEEVEALLKSTERKLRTSLALTPDIAYNDGAIEYRGEVLRNYTADRLVALVEAGRNPRPLANFLARLQSNPSFRVVDKLYSFLEHGNIPLTPDGHFLAYKAVRKDYKDIHSGKFDNSVGCVCQMPRNKVNEDPNVTCSYGLHVCSFDYLPHFVHADGHVMVVSVDPADVVAIPADYNDTKMRVSKYVVVGEVHDYYDKKEDVLGHIGTSEGVVHEYYVNVEFDGSRGEERHSAHYAFDSAKTEALRLLSLDSVVFASVEDENGDVLWSGGSEE